MGPCVRRDDSEFAAEWKLLTANGTGMTIPL
jgi:hypothetical protein